MLIIRLDSSAKQTQRWFINSARVLLFASLWTRVKSLSYKEERDRDQIQIIRIQQELKRAKQEIIHVHQEREFYFSKYYFLI